MSLEEVIITVNGGVAEVVKVPVGVRVVIRDYDGDGADHDEDDYPCNKAAYIHEDGQVVQE